MEQASVCVRMDAALKSKFEDFCNDMGMTMTTAINIFARKVVREKRIPFDIGYSQPNDETLMVMEEADEMVKSGKYGKTYSDVDEMMKELLP